MKPIIMGAEDVRGILDGRKTMARVPVKQSIVDRFVIDTWGELLGSFTDKFGDYPSIDDCPYHPGDVLWVRETWAGLSENEYIYQADDPDVNVWKIWRDKGVGSKYERWMSPVTMPSEAARLFLRVTDVRVERIHSITVEDAVKEGVYTDTPGYWDNGWSPTFNDPDSGGEPNYINGFKMEWDARNAKRGYGWDSNPWVWVYTFERITKKEGEHGH